MDKKILNEHAQNYVHEVMAEQLIREGFISKNGQELQWYRVVNGEILQAVFFYTQWAAMPILMGIAYSCHPLFITPEYPSGVHMRTMMRSLEAVNPGRYIMKQTNNMIFSKSAAVTCPDDPYRGTDILSDIISKLNGIQTIEQCYAAHKQRYITAAKIVKLPPDELFWNISPDFMDEAVYINDQEMYPYCAKRIESELQRYEKAQTVRKLCNAEKADLEALYHLKIAIMEEKREEHLVYLQERQLRNIHQLKRRVKGCVD